MFKPKYKPKYSDEILARMDKEGRSLTKSERQELREAYLHEQEQDKKDATLLQERAESFKEEVTILPRHIMQGKCPWFEECPLDFKCKNYDSKYIKCQNCPLHEQEGICFKKDLHTPKNIAMMITRPRIEIEG